jgi:hypothetical protein
MTEFLLRIFFSGLIALVPNSDGTEVTVVLVHTPHEYTLAGGDTLPHHHPMLLARANCEGTCTTESRSEIAKFLFANKTQAQAETALNAALAGGGVWDLNGWDLSINGPTEPLAIRTGVRERKEDGTLTLVPKTPEEREDFSWVADLSAIAPQSGGFKKSLTLPEAPSKCVVAARLKLRNGKLFTYSLVKVGPQVRPIHFRKPSGSGPEAPYAQALANWVAADIRVQGESVEIVAQDFADSTKTRSMTLRPQNGKVEIAMLNLPPFEPPDPASPPPSPAPGQHFQVFYDLVQKPPAHTERLVPHQALSPSEADPQFDWAAVHPRLPMWSDLLEQLGLSPKAPYDLAICPIIRE